MLTRRKRKILLWSSVFVFIAIVPVALLYVLGYRLDQDWNLQKTGGLYISSPVGGSEIFIDGEIQRKTGLLQSGVFVQSLTPRPYHIMVKREGYRDWEKELRVFPQTVTEARALLIPHDPKAEVLWRGKFHSLMSSPFDPLLLLVEERRGGNFLTFYLPNSNEFLSFEPPQNTPTTTYAYKKSFELVRWREGGAVLLLDGIPRRISFDFSRRIFRFIPLGNEPPRKLPEDILRDNTRFDNRGFLEIVFDPKLAQLSSVWKKGGQLPYYLEQKEEILLESRLRNFEFYPLRRDATLVAFDNGVWALELDGRGGRSIEPIYKGKNPNFATLPGQSELYLLDDGILIRLDLIPEESV